MKAMTQKLADNMNPIIVVALIAIAIVAVFKVDSLGSANGPAVVESSSASAD